MCSLTTGQVQGVAGGLGALSWVGAISFAFWKALPGVVPRRQRLGWLLRFRWVASGMDSNWDTGPHGAWSEGEGEGSLITSHS